MLGLLLLLGLFVGMYAAQAMLYTRYGMRRLSYRCRFDRTEVEEGEELCLIEEIENSGFLPMPWVKSEYSVSRHLDFAGTHSVVTGDTRFVSSLFFLRVTHASAGSGRCVPCSVGNTVSGRCFWYRLTCWVLCVIHGQRRI